MTYEPDQLLRQLQIERTRFEALLAAAPIGLGFVDTDLRYVQVNHTLASFSGVPMSEHPGRTVRAITPAFAHPLESSIRQVLTSGQPILHQELSGSTAFSPEPRSWLASYYPLFGEDGRVLGVGLAVMDITEHKRTEQDLHALLTREQTARAEVEAASRAKDEFLSTVSHELRTPLSAMLGWVRLLRSGRLDQETSQRALEAIERSAKAQAQLIEDVLDVSRITTGRLRIEPRPMDLARSIEAAVESVRPAAEAKGIDIATYVDPSVDPVRGDPDRMQQIVWNLLSNAIRFTPSGGHVEVRLARIDPFVELTVRDTGVGIRPEFLPHVFERFRQADGTTTRTHGGLGLGLAIVRHLVEIHGGTVQVKSEGENRGATFTVRIPVPAMRVEVEEDEEAASAAVGDAADGVPQQTPGLLGVRVLVVDDEADAREALTAVLEHYGATVAAAASAEEALSRISDVQPNVLVSDIGMPGQDGYALIRAVRSLEKERGGGVSALALTAYARAEDRRRALDAGYHMHVSKPVDPAALATAVAQLAGLTAGPSSTQPANGR
jgi:PAS domain S-box-containing protein